MPFVINDAANKRRRTMVTINRFALAFAALGSGAAISACAAQKSNMHASEVPAASHAGAKSSCGANASCGATKQTASVNSMKMQASCGAKTAEVAPNNAKSDTDVNASAANGQVGPSATVTSSAPMRTPSKRMAKKAGAQGGCGQGSCG